MKCLVCGYDVPISASHQSLYHCIEFLKTKILELECAHHYKEEAERKIVNLQNEKSILKEKIKVLEKALKNKE